MNKTCILLLPLDFIPAERIQTIPFCSIKSYINIGTVSTEELINSLLLPISILQNFSSIIFKGNICKVLTTEKELGLHKMIQKWTWHACEALTNVEGWSLIICESKFLSPDNISGSPLCGINSFHCNDGSCLASTSLCDETNCLALADAGSHKCKDGKMITAVRRCNLITDCSDGDDVVNCFHFINGCTEQFRCIDLKYICDGFFNCVDHSDEKVCLESCNFGFLCIDSSCAYQNVKDDLIPDCKDNSDELMYQLLLSRGIVIQYRCPEMGKIPCERGHNRCFPLTSLCKLEYDIHNNITPCHNGAHLKYCRHFPCTEYHRLSHLSYLDLSDNLIL